MEMPEPVDQTSAPTRPRRSSQRSVGRSRAVAAGSAGDELRIVYICGSGHSGSTLLEMMLAGHSAVAAVGEVQNLHHQILIGRVCSCGRLPQACPRWMSVRNAVERARGIDIFAAPKSFRISRERPNGLSEHVLRLWNRCCYYAHFRHHWLAPLSIHRLAIGGKSMRENEALLLSTFMSLAGARILVDSSKDYVRMREVHDFAEPGAVRVVHLVRDGRGCVWSVVKRHRTDVKTAAREWAKNQRRTRAMLRGVDAGRRLLLRYEDLCGDPDGTLHRVCSFLGLEFEDGMLQLDPTDHHTIAGNRIRVNRRMSIALDEGWQQGLSADDLRVFERRAGRENRRLGYGP